ncbi:MAG: hypothetical protein RR805_13840, partial [Hafnia sp.]
SEGGHYRGFSGSAQMLWVIEGQCALEDGGMWRLLRTYIGLLFRYWRNEQQSRIFGASLRPPLI